MKKRRTITITLILFTISMTFILIFFNTKNTNTRLINQTNKLISILYSMDSGTYILDKGYLYNEVGLVNETKYVNADGKITIDKYKNIIFDLNYKNKCIYKTALGNTKVEETSCKERNNIDISISKNNNNISFTTTKQDLEYLISTKDNLKGTWIKEEYKDSIIIKSYNEGDNYIWFKDQEGNLTESIKFNINCLNTTNAKYDKEIFYCASSTVNINNEEWLVLKDTSSKITLMKVKSLEEKEMCTKDSIGYCYYNEESSLSYTWSNSYINYYLNYEYINELSDIIDNLEETYICDDINQINTEDNYTGMLKEEILSNNLTCNNYTKSKIRLITYNEFNNIYSKIKDNKELKSNFWSLNSYIKDYSSSITNNYEYYIKENPTNKLEVKPVITLIK